MPYVYKRAKVDAFRTLFDTVITSFEEGEEVRIEGVQLDSLETTRFRISEALKCAEFFSDMYDGKYAELRKHAQVSVRPDQGVVALVPKEAAKEAYGLPSSLSIHSSGVPTALAMLSSLMEKKIARPIEFTLSDRDIESVKKGIQTAGYEVEYLKDEGVKWVGYVSPLQEGSGVQTKDEYKGPQRDMSFEEWNARLLKSLEEDE